MTAERKSNRKKVKTISDSYIKQIMVLKSMADIEPDTKHPKMLQINEIAELSGLTDEREIQRYLFILEGQKLVTPYPVGDFTSKTWHITIHGLKAIRGMTRPKAA